MAAYVFVGAYFVVLLIAYFVVLLKAYLTTMSLDVEIVQEFTGI